jgi:hypothetical protein
MKKWSVVSGEKVVSGRWSVVSEEVEWLIIWHLI